MVSRVSNGLLIRLSHPLALVRTCRVLTVKASVVTVESRTDGSYTGVNWSHTPKTPP